MLDDIGMDNVPFKVVLEDIKEQRRTRVAVSKGVSSSGKAATSVSLAKASATVYGIFKRGPPSALTFGDLMMVDVESSSSSSASRDDDFNEALMLEEPYFGAAPDGPGDYLN
ncbi:hypothetical protein AMTRI_Chr06g171070 [Amborella trichopoda]